jgi:hypothetical protein
MMRGNIVNLRTIISGGTGLNGDSFRDQDKRIPLGEKATAKALSIFRKNKDQKAATTGRVRADKVIPFEDGEFKDF